MKQIIFLCKSERCTGNSSTFYIIGNLNITQENISTLKDFEDKKILIENFCPNCKQKQVINITSIELQREFNLQNI